jgi:hypothetical protein
MSTAILTISENGELQRIHDLWLGSSACDLEGNQIDSDQLSLSSFWGLFLITGAASLGSVILYVIRLLIRFCREGYHVDSLREESWSSRGVGLVRSFASYVDEPGPRLKTASKKPKVGAGQASGREIRRDSSSSFASSNDPRLPPRSNGSASDIELQSSAMANRYVAFGTV